MSGADLKKFAEVLAKAQKHKSSKRGRSSSSSSSEVEADHVAKWRSTEAMKGVPSWVFPPSKEVEKNVRSAAKRKGKYISSAPTVFSAHSVTSASAIRVKVYWKSRTMHLSVWAR